MSDERAFAARVWAAELPPGLATWSEEDVNEVCQRQAEIGEALETVAARWSLREITTENVSPRARVAARAAMMWATAVLAGQIHDEEELVALARHTVADACTLLFVAANAGGLVPLGEAARAAGTAHHGHHTAR